MYTRLKKFMDVLSKILIAIGMVTLMVAVIIVFYEVITRYFMSKSDIWAEEIVRYLILGFSGFLCAGPVFVNKGNISLEVLYVRIKSPKLRSAVDIFNTIMTAIISALLCKWGFDLMISSLGTKTMSMVFPAAFPYSMLPIGMMLSLLYCVLQLIVHILEFKNPELAPKSEEEGEAS